jgi:hypothetical protein
LDGVKEQHRPPRLIVKTINDEERRSLAADEGAFRPMFKIVGDMALWFTECSCCCARWLVTHRYGCHGNDIFAEVASERESSWEERVGS